MQLEKLKIHNIFICKPNSCAYNCCLDVCCVWSPSMLVSYCLVLVYRFENAGSLCEQRDLQSWTDEQSSKTCAVLAHIVRTLPRVKFCLTCRKYFVFWLFVFKQALTVTFRCKKMKKLLGWNLLKPAVYMLGLFLVFIMLISSSSMPVSWMIQDIIDPVSLIESLNLYKSLKFSNPFLSLN